MNKIPSLITVNDYLNSNHTDIVYILEFILDKTKSQLWLEPNYKLKNSEKQKIDKIIIVRNSGMPLAYITKNQFFYGLNFKVNKNVLIPRCDTELLIDIALNIKFNTNTARILELATGSGIIAIILSDKNSNWQITASDISKLALDVAIDNKKLSSNYHNINFILSDWFNKITKTNKFAMIIANPPYIAENDWHLQQLKQEPKQALVAKNNGMYNLEHIINNAPKYLINNGYLLLEHGYNQQKEVVKLLNKNYHNIKTFNDLGGNNRAVLATVNKTAKSYML